MRLLLADTSWAWIAAALLLAALPARGQETGSAAPDAGGPSRFVAITDVKANIVDAGGPTGSLLVDLSVEARSPAHAQDLATMLPRLRATSVRTVSEFATLHASAWKPVDARLLQRRLTTALLVTDPRVKSVHVVSVRAAP